MMKAGILTLFQADSYGAVLQAFALQQTLLSLGVESELVNFPAREIIGPARRVSGIETAKPLMAVLKKEFGKRTALFEEFRNSRLRVSEPFTLAEGQQVNAMYDLFIAGSDQVWNVDNPDVDLRYFLTFAKDGKKYSYAASFGAERLSEKAEETVRKYLPGFQRISVREKSGQTIVKELLGRDAVLCLDPVFLPEREAWEALANPPEEGDYLLVYMLHENRDMLAWAREYAQKHNLQIRYVTEGFCVNLGMKPWNSVSVCDWLGLVKNAKAVVTNSFHGVAFSLIFRRSFRFFRLEGAASGRNDRIMNLFEQLGVREEHFSEIPEENWEQVDALIQNRREASLGYLKEITERK